jgi:hypothetical protein
MLPDKSMDEVNMNGFGGPGQPGRGNVGMAVLAGAGVAIVGALIWGVIAYATKYQFSVIAVLVGFAVGTVMARVGGARSTALGVASAVLAVAGCALGSLVAEILVFQRQGAPMSAILADLNVVFRFYPSAVGGLGFVFWALAALYGYRVAMGMPMRWGLGRRRTSSRGPVPGQPYGAPGQPYGAPGDGYNVGQAYGAPGQPYGAPGDGYNAGQAYGAPPGAAPQPGGAAPGPAEPNFGFKQPPPGFDSPQPPAP